MSTTTPPDTTAGNGAQPRKLSLIDLGEYSRERVKKLRKGQGKLMRKVEETIEVLSKEGVVQADAGNVVVVIVREEPWGLLK